MSDENKSAPITKSGVKQTKQPDKPAAETTKSPKAPAATKPPTATKPPADSQQPAKAAQPEPASATTQAKKACLDRESKFALVVDDEPANRDFLVRLLEQAQLEVKGAADASDALNKLEGVECARLIAIDHSLPDMEGIELMAQLRKRYPGARLIMATMHDDRKLMARAFENGCDVFLVKPHGFMELFRRVQLLDEDEEELKKMVIDQFGPRPYRG